jgi:hypothetical protein
MLAPPSPPRRIPMPRHVNTNAWLLAGWLAVTLMSVGPAPAQSPDAVAAAKELMTTMKSVDQFKAIMPSLMNALKPAIVQNRPEVARDFDLMAPKLVESMAARFDELIDGIAAIYARNFTAAELNEIIAFYRGPVGQKFVQKQGGILQDSLAAGQKWGQALGAELQRRMTDELRKKGHNI